MSIRTTKKITRIEAENLYIQRRLDNIEPKIKKEADNLSDNEIEEYLVTQFDNYMIIG